MAQRLRVITTVGLAVTAIMAMLTFNVSAQMSSACMTTFVSLSPCLNFISGNALSPTSACCSTLTNVVKNEPQCFCMLLNGGASSTVGVYIINATKTLQLPPLCMVETPPASLCDTLEAPAAAPKASTVTPSTTPPPPVSSSPPAGSKATPTTTGVSSDAISSKSAVISIFFLAVSALASMI